MLKQKEKQLKYEEKSLLPKFEVIIFLQLHAKITNSHANIFFKKKKKIKIDNYYSLKAFGKFYFKVVNLKLVLPNFIIVFKSKYKKG